MPTGTGSVKTVVDCESEPGRTGLLRVPSLGASRVPSERDRVPSYLTTPNITPRVRRRRRYAALTSLTLGVALVATTLPTASATATATTRAVKQHSTSPTDAQVARYGAGYLATQITANGGFLAPFGAPDVSNTAYAVLGLHAAGVGAKASQQAITFLKTQVATGLVGDDNLDNPGLIADTILAAVAAGQDPRHFGGHRAANNLVHRLLVTARASGTDKGLFGTADPTFDGAFRQGLALAALKAAHVPARRVGSSIHWLTRQQCSNGLWTSYRSDVTVPCPAADPDTFAGPDTNSTSLAVQGLAAYRLHPRKRLVIKGFHQIQGSDAGFPFLAAPGQTSDPNSTALSIQALLAEGVSSATLHGFHVSGATPYDALASFQLGCSDPASDRGGFFFSADDRSVNVLATVQAVPAMAHQTLPLRASSVSRAVPVQPCASTSSRSTALLRTATALQSAAKPAAAKALAGKAGACPGTTGVTVAVDFTAFTGGTVQVRCAPGTPATGVAALQQAGFTPAGTAKYGLAFICRINSLPSTAQQACVTTPPATAYWSYYHASHTATTWTYSTSGASTYKPAQGSIQGWAFGNSAKPSKTPAQVRATKS
jgi:hypothetical protein